MDLTCIAQFSNPVTADIARGMLENHGIRAIVDNGTILSVLPMPSAIGGARLMVLESDAQEALRLLGEHGDLE